MRIMFLFFVLFPVFIFAANDIEIIHTPINKAEIGKSLTFELNVSNAHKVNFIFLHYCPFVTQDWIQKEFIPKNGKYSVELEGEEIVKDGIVYYIEVVDIDNNISSFKSKDSPQYIETFQTSENRTVEVNNVNTETQTENNNKKYTYNLEDELSMFAETEVKIVTASKKAEYLKDAPAIVTVMSKKNMERIGASSLIDVLKQVPGIEVSMSITGDYRVSIRGVRKDGNILMLINNHRINDLYDAKAFYNIPTDFIERIEIIRGPGSALFGTNAVVGIINIFTTEDDKIIKLLGGTNKTLGVNTSYTTDWNNKKLTITTGYSQSDGNNAEINDDNANDKEWSLTYQDKKYKTNLWNKNAYFGVVLKNDKLNFSVIDIFKKQGIWTGPSFLAAPDSEYLRNQIISDISYTHKITKILTITPKLYSDIGIVDNLIQEAPDGYFKEETNIFEDGKLTKEKYTAFTIGSDMQLTFDILENFDIITGLTAEYLTMNDYSLSRNYQLSTDEYKKEFGDYDNTLIEQKGKKRTIIAYYFQSNYNFETIGIVAGFRFDRYSDFGNSFNPRLGFVYKPLKDLSLKLLYGQAFRAPTFKELYDNTNISSDGIIGDKNLKPETVKSGEFGIEYTFWKILLRSNIFYNITNDMISSFDEHGSGGVGRYANIGSTNSYGTEGEIIASFHKNFGIYFNMSWVETIFEWNNDVFKANSGKSPSLSEKEKVLYNFPNLRINGGLNFKLFDFEGFAGVNYGNESINNHRRTLEKQHPVKIPDYISFNFNIMYNLTDNFVIRVIGKNIGTQKYSDPDESNYIDAFGEKGIAQPTQEYMGYLIYKF